MLKKTTSMWNWRTPYDSGFSRNTTDEIPEHSDGSTASYYELPEGVTELQDLISQRDMNAQMGEIFRAVYRYGRVSHSSKKRDIKKILFYAKAELERLNKLEEKIDEYIQKTTTS